MFRYEKITDFSLQEFEMGDGGKLDAGNRWVILAGLVPWDEFAGLYKEKLSAHRGAPSVDARVVLGALIIKHRLKLDDREVIEMIRENPYMQYFLGLRAFQSKDVFSPTLFVLIRHRVGVEMFDEVGLELLRRVKAVEQAAAKAQEQGSKEPGEGGAGSGAAAESAAQSAPVSGEAHKGVLKMDATVCDQYIRYPTDLTLVSQARRESERLIDALCRQLRLKVKPRTYREKARQQYLAASKSKKLTGRKRKAAIGRQLRYLKRNLGHLDKLLDKFEQIPFKKRRDYKIYLVIQHVYAQQEQMWRLGVNRCDHRIVSIYQPHVRPIVRGKAGRNTEFGSKISVSLSDGWAFLDALRWEAYNETEVLQSQVLAYRAVHGYWPQTVVADNIYGSRKNRNWLKARDIKFQIKPLGRPPAQQTAKKQKDKNRISRNDMEGKFGEGKNGFELNRIRAQLIDTSESWIAAIFFVMNLHCALRRIQAAIDVLSQNASWLFGPCLRCRATLVASLQMPRLAFRPALRRLESHRPNPALYHARKPPTF